MYLDSAINRKPTVVRNIYKASLMAAFRFHAIVTNILRAFTRTNTKVDTSFCVRAIELFCRRMVNFIGQLVQRNRQVRVDVSRREIRWLGLEAFHRKLARHGDVYAQIVTRIGLLHDQCDAGLPPDNAQKIKQ